MKLYTVLVPQREAWRVVKSFKLESDAVKLSKELNGRIMIERRGANGKIKEVKEKPIKVEKEKYIKQVKTRCVYCGEEVIRDRVSPKTVCFNCKKKQTKARSLTYLFNKNK